LPEGDPAARFEDACSGQWIGRTTGMEARAAFDATSTAAAKAIETSATRVARLCQNLQLIFDPALIVIGGGVGLAPTYLDRVRQTLAHLPDHYRPTLTAAALGRDAGAVGIAALTTSRN
jgi:N-acylmannosamine kinase/N-acetylmannosamine-6-phosphate 2-epimerase/N-acetylmannosamine kinase